MSRHKCFTFKWMLSKLLDPNVTSQNCWIIRTTPKSPRVCLSRIQFKLVNAFSLTSKGSKLGPAVIRHNAYCNQWDSYHNLKFWLRSTLQIPKILTPFDELLSTSKLFIHLACQEDHINQGCLTGGPWATYNC